ncbi:very short patch repair endonuclease [Methylobacterium sp. UNC300MFChir4.1]|uniref:very short patch repair endonuclease n=1 Tax=Methylobacterium sp. UNC300MFChir4.1 TaxID=1502747 RepID=UPI000C20FFF6|nr:very short patch repair endonuclease [Methylobacterium sp. UNC300MFChir4.1]
MGNSFKDAHESTRRVMRANKARGTKPELLVRRSLHSLGYRFRLHRRDLPGSPDIVLPRHRVAIQVHGCFWHQHEGCRHANLPRSRTAYWHPKLARNVERDVRTNAALRALGWRVLVLWECELKDLDALRDRLRTYLLGSDEFARPLSAS